jgi:hypothetical protein
MTLVTARPSTQRHRATLLLVLLLGAIMRIAPVDRPLDHRLLAPWRESDHVQVARNFYRGDLDILYPQIDWRGDQPGYAEMEFPALPWLGAVAARVVGYDEVLLRVPSAVLGVASLAFFARMALATLPPTAALVAVAAFAFNPLLVAMGSALQPDALMLFLVLLATVLMWRWDDDPTTGKLLVACAAIGAAIVAKLPAAHLGIVMAYLAIRKSGARVLASPASWLGALIALVPPLVWYVWAHRFWERYGLSLGVSNESHLLGWDMLARPRFLVGLVKWETLAVFTPAGWLLAAVALRAPLARTHRFLVWYAAVSVFYLVSARTSADDWAFYYHGASVAPACLLMGAGAGAFVDGAVLPRRWARLARWEPWLGRALVAGTVLGLLSATGYLVYKRDHQRQLFEMRSCMLDFTRYVPADGMIVVRGGEMHDEYGRPVAHNESMAFAWMDRKGFNYGDEELGLETLERIAARGGRYWIVREDEMRPELRVSAARRWKRIAACEFGYVLYDLSERPES